MKILIAEDDPVSRVLVEQLLRKWGFDVMTASSGVGAWQVFEGGHAPPIAIFDWLMPEMDGLELCRKLRATPRTPATYIILLTIRGSQVDIVQGFEAGADDYITKPFDSEELRARVQVAARIVNLQWRLADRVRELEETLARVKQLQGLLPICSYCKKIRNDSNYWQQVESYISEHSQAYFTHGVCPDCYEKVVKQHLEQLGPLGSERIKSFG